MSKDNKIHMPSSGGGLVRYTEDSKSKFMISPYIILGLIVVIAIIEIFLYKTG